MCGKERAGVLHKKAVSKVKAAAQAEALHRILDNLTTEEHDIVRKGETQKQVGGVPPMRRIITTVRHLKLC